MKVQGVLLVGRPTDKLWDLEVEDGHIKAITHSTIDINTRTTQPPPLVLPSLCHPHIHLDKPYLLTSHASATGQNQEKLPDYSDLVPATGSFSEAIANTSKAKARYTEADLLLRGRQLLASSFNNGVTHVRAFVEVDHVTNELTVAVGVQLKREFARRGLVVQLVAYAQDPIFSTEHGDKNRALLEHVLDKYADDIDVLGTTPYVEEDFDNGLTNIEWAIRTAIKRKLHLDLHIDFNIDIEKPSMVWDVLRMSIEQGWVKNQGSGRTIVLGHCSRMSLFTEEEGLKLAMDIYESELPLYFVGLPTSDVYMMGRPAPRSQTPQEREGSVVAPELRGKRPRGTIQIVSMIKDFGLDACIGVNNVGNAFTPFGSGDPMISACFGVGVYHAGTEDDARTLYECVSTRARQAIGYAATIEEREEVCLEEGQKANLIAIKNQQWIDGTADEDGQNGIPARQRIGITDVVWDPPPTTLRQILR